MTCFPSTTTFVLVLGADSPCSDERRAGNLGLTARGLFTLFNATHVSIRTSDTSSSPLEPPSQAYRTLPYHVDASLEFARRRRQSRRRQTSKREMAVQGPEQSVRDPNRWNHSHRDVAERLFAGLRANSSEASTSAASVTGLAPLHLPRRKTRSVSYYAFFEGWLLLSQLPDCLSLPTSFPT